MSDGNFAHPDDDLLEVGHAGQGDGAEFRRIGRHVAPAEDLGAFGFDNAFDGFDAAIGDLCVGRHEENAHAIGAGLGELEAELGGPVLEEAMRHLEQEPRAIAGLLVAAHGAAMLEVNEDGGGVADDFVVGFGVEPGNESHAAAVMFVARMVEPLWLGLSGGVASFESQNLALLHAFASSVFSWFRSCFSGRSVGDGVRSRAV